MPSESKVTLSEARPPVLPPSAEATDFRSEACNMKTLRAIPVRPAVLAGLLAVMTTLYAEPPSRIHADIQGRQTFHLRGNVHPLLASAEDQGQVPDTLALPRVTIHFALSPAQQADLDRLVGAQQDPSSPQYHRWLTPESFGERFGISSSDLGRITAWLERAGFTRIRPARSRTFVTMSGTAAQARMAFQTPMHSYRVNGEPHYANVAEPSLPVELQGMVLGIRGLDDFHPHPYVRSRPRFTSSLSGENFLAPGDFATIYDLTPLYDRGINGAGQSIAIIGAADVPVSSIEAFQAASGLPAKAPQIILDGDPPVSDSGAAKEALLDLEWSGAVAPGANLIFVNSADFFGSALYAIDNNLAPVISLSAGNCEGMTAPNIVLNQGFEQANAMGITVVVASGDFGPFGCYDGYGPTGAATFPASSPYVTSMGGTEFNEGTTNYWSSTNNANGGSALSYIPEMAWNDNAVEPGIAATGGGASSIYAKPSWQAGPGVPADGARDVPDLALAASAYHDPYLFCEPTGSKGLPGCTNGYRDSQNYLDVTGGTSAAAPTFAGIVAMILQATGSRQGNLNPALYQLAASSNNAFHDITAGNNFVPCGFPGCVNGYAGYSAGPGYDLTTGLGSIDAANLIAALSSTTTSPPTAPVLTAPANAAAGVVNPATLSWQAGLGWTTYNVYFGTSSPPPLVAQGIADTTYNPGTLSAATTYYWSVTALKTGGSASSAIWSFTTLAGPALSFPPNGATGVASPLNLVWQASPGAASYTVYFGTSSPPDSWDWTSSTAYNPGTLSAGTTYYWSVTAKSAADSAASATWSFTTSSSPGGNPGGLVFVPVTPCRIVDTRAIGGPLAAGSTRSFTIPQSGCSIPGTAQAYSLNVTVVPQGPLPYLTLWPAGQTRPVVSTLNAFTGDVTANAAIVPAGSDGAVSVFAAGATDVILDVDGYFDASSGPTSYVLYPTTPCRVADTRGAPGQFGGPSMTSGQKRDFPIPLGPCAVPATARAYSLNVTAVPAGYLGYLTTWPTGDAQPDVSTLNSWTGKVVANAALVPAGTNEAISVFVSNPTNVILDVNGYFGAPGSAGALSFYPVTPCRAADTRSGGPPFGAPEMAAQETRSFPVPASGCGVPATARAYALNVTVVPDGPLSFLTTWPTGSAQPLVSTLNSFDGSVVANAAIVPAGADGTISVFVTGRTHVILDINGYFAP